VEFERGGNPDRVADAEEGGCAEEVLGRGEVGVLNGKSVFKSLVSRGVLGIVYEGCMNEFGGVLPSTFKGSGVYCRRVSALAIYIIYMRNKIFLMHYNNILSFPLSS